jgi:hypothetical protein
VPFLGETDTDTALARLNRDPTDLTRLRPTLPDGLAPLIHRLLSRKPDDRYHSGAEVRAELQRIAALPRHDQTTDGSRPVDNANNTRATPAGGIRPRTGTTTAVMPATGSAGAPVRQGRPAGAPTRVDRTPPSPTRPRQQPNRKFEQRRAPSMVIVGGLLIAAFVVGLVLWITMGTSTGGTFKPTTTTAATSTAGTGNGTGNGTGTGTAAPGGNPPPVGGAGIASVRTFDPDGDGQENDQAARNVLDHNLATAWTTVCYSSRYMGGKEGVGLIADLGSARTGMVNVAIGNGPFQMRVYASAAAQPPGSFNDWGRPLHTFGGDAAQTITQQLTQPARWVLVSFVEIGRSPACSTNPYRGSIQELTVN